MILASWNVNGIRSIHKKGYFMPFVENVKPDIICLQETKAEEHQSEVDLPEYEEYWNASMARKGYAGTAIFTKQKPVSVILGLPEDIVEQHSLSKDVYGDPNREGRVITLEFPGFFITSVYTPNSKSDLSRLSLRHKHWDPAFLAFVKQLDKQKPVIFCGDLNVAHTSDDLAHPKENEGEHGFTKEEREGVNNIIKAGFVDSFRHFIPNGNGHYTWWTNFSNARARNIGWRIDYFFVSKQILAKLKSAKIHSEFYGSDHCPISIEMNI